MRTLVLSLLAFPVIGQTITDRDLREAGGRSDWITTGRDYAETHYSPLKEINASNVSRLGLAWSADMETRRGLEATPIVVNGVMYVTGSWSVVYAFDVVTGKRLWRWDPEVSRAWGQRACCDVVNRGVAVYGNRVFVATLDGRLAALRASDGIPQWQVQTTDKNQSYTITGAPRIVKGKVIIGNGGAEYGVRGYVSAYDAGTGKLDWRFYIVPGDPSKPFENAAMEKAAKTWTGEWWKFGGGGTPWDSFAFDPELDLLYVGTGNGSPWNWKVRSPGGGDNLYLSSILALRPETGELVWHYQTTPGDSWDYTAVQQMILTTLTLDGRPRKVLMQAPKNGFFYVLDRATGELLSAKPFVTINWATGVDMKTGRPVENPEARAVDPAKMFLQQPGPLGGHNWQPMSYHPGTGLVYIPAQDMVYPYLGDANFKYLTGGAWNLGMLPLPSTDPLAMTPGYLLAWDPVKESARWSVKYPTYWNGGVLSTAGNLVLQGTAAGNFVAYNAENGDKLWEVPVHTGVMAAPATYTVNGKQYISVLAGWGGAFGIVGGNASGDFGTPGRLLTFALDGKAAMPAGVAPMAVPKPMTLDADQKTIEAGSLEYARWCVWCHGFAAVSGGVVKDLRYSSEATYAAYPKIVLDGTFVQAGMPAFKQWLSNDDVAAIRAFVISQRNKIAK
jgi:PQQ-dependent dehydrogenase (methanol/ethanol family)